MKFKQSFKSIRTKLVFIYLALVFIVMIVSGTFILNSIRLNEANLARSQTGSYADYIEEDVIAVLSPADFHEALSENRMPASFTINSLEGSILYPTGKTMASSVPIANYSDSAIISAMDGEEKFRPWADGDLFTYARPVFSAEGEESVLQYIIYIRMPADSALSNLFGIATTIFLSVVLALTLTVVLGLLFAGTLTEPLVTLTRSSQKMAKGDLRQMIPVNSNDEIGQLTESLNLMAEDLNSAMEKITDEKNKLEIVQHNMTDGVLAYDNSGNLIHANYACRELLNMAVEKLSFKDMTKILGIDLDDLSSLSQSAVKESTIFVGDKYLSSNLTVYLNNYGQVGGVVIVLQNITKHKMLDNMRKEFVANVSHEIRTPLTTVKSYAETLLDGALEDRDIAVEFLNIINSEADRMTLLVKDLLDLSKLDNKDYVLELKEVNLIDIVNNCITQNKILASQKRQRIIFEPHRELMPICADEGRINQVITNVLSNAIKYSFEESEIECSIDETDKYYRLYVADHGMGIPKEDLPRIFERFYRVDKARSRAMGGTGLGLSIAKQIMEAHNGRISAISELNKGTTMILRFDKLVSEK